MSFIWLIQPKPVPVQWWLGLLLLVGLTLASLACGFGGLGFGPSSAVVIRTRLPTLTPTIDPNLPPGAEQAQSDTALASPTRLRITPAAGVTVITNVETPQPSNGVAAGSPVQSEGWEFSGVRLAPDPELGDLIVYGEVINNTGSAQKVAGISGIFYDGQGQVMDATSFDYVPLDTIPPDGRMPFELTAIGLEDAVDVDLQIDARPGGQAPRQDFAALDMSSTEQGGEYCVTGRLQNPGSPLSSYLTIVIVLYNSQEQMINFGNDHRPASSNLALDFEICVDRQSQEVARYELRAWGE